MSRHLSIRIGRRYARWAMAMVAVPLLWACNERPLQSPGCRVTGIERDIFEQFIDNDLDIVFVIDNSDSMADNQQNVARNFPVFMNVLKSIEGGLPNVHIGVVSSSLGAGTFDVPGCPSGGDGGAFLARPGPGCSAVPRDSATYLTSFKSGTQSNFDGPLEDVFSCIATLGTGGCGFESVLMSPARALGANLAGYAGPAPAGNAGFLRPDALLALVLVTNEDDCSAPADSDLFDPKQVSVSDEYGPFNSFRCTEFGILCGGQKPPRYAPVKNLQDCHSAEESGKLVKIADLVNFFKGVKPVPNRVIVSAIAAPPTPFSVELNSGVPDLSPSCSSGGGKGYPAVRIKEFVDAFGVNGSFNSVCSQDFADAMTRIANRIKVRFGPQCIGSVLADMDPETPGVQPECQVINQTVTASGFVETPLGQCGSSAPPCWKLVPDSAKCAVSGYAITIDRGVDVLPPPNTTVAVKCTAHVNTRDANCGGQ